MDGEETIDSGERREALRPGPEDLPSVELAQRARDGDPEARDHLLARYVPFLRRWATSRLPRRACDLLDTDDMIQATILGTLRDPNLSALRRDGALATHLRKRLLDQVRDAVARAAVRRRPEAPAEGRPDDGVSPLEAAIGRAALDRYEAALQRLPEEDRELVVARIELGLDFAAVAREMGASDTEAARLAVRRALLRLAAEMGGAAA